MNAVFCTVNHFLREHPARFPVTKAHCTAFMLHLTNNEKVQHHHLEGAVRVNTHLIFDC